MREKTHTTSVSSSQALSEEHWNKLTEEHHDDDGYEDLAQTAVDGILQRDHLLANAQQPQQPSGGPAEQQKDEIFNGGAISAVDWSFDLVDEEHRQPRQKIHQ